MTWSQKLKEMVPMKKIVINGEKVENEEQIL